MFPGKGRNTFLHRLIASDYFERAPVREAFGRFQSGNMEKHIRTSPDRALAFSLRCPATFGCDRLSLFGQNSNRLSQEWRSNLLRICRHFERRKQWTLV